MQGARRVSALDENGKVVWTVSQVPVTAVSPAFVWALAAYESGHVWSLAYLRTQAHKRRRRTSLDTGSVFKSLRSKPCQGADSEPRIHHALFCPGVFPLSPW